MQEAAFLVPTPLYDRMCLAIQECAKVDEAKDIRDKAAALAVYFRQIENTEAEHEALSIRVRAERRAGELLKQLARTEPAEAGRIGGSTPEERERLPSPYAQALADTGMSTQQASRYQRLADVPEDEFETALATPGKRPSVSQLIAEGRRTQVTDQSLLLWDSLRDLDRLLQDPASEPLHRMTDEMRADVVRLVPAVIRQLKALKEALHDHP
jgi:hypothetical protein